MSLNYTSAVGNPPDPRTLAFLDWVDDLVQNRLNGCPLSRGTTYYIAQDNAGDNTGGGGAGTGNDPWLVSDWNDAATLINNNMGVNRRFRLKRGDLYRGSTQVTVDAENVTIDAYGSGAKPYITHFTETVASGGGTWVLDSGTTYYITGVATETVGLRRQDDRLYETNGPMCWVTALVNVGTVVTNTYGTWFWDTASSRLYIDIGEDPNSYDWEYAFIDATNEAAILLGDVDGLRCDNIKADGWGLDQQTANGGAGTQRHALKCEPTGTNAVVFTNCESYFGSSHAFAFNGGVNSGGISLFKDCKAGWCSFNGTATETIFNSYCQNGGHETIFDGCEVLGGCLPITTTPDDDRSMGFYNHTGGTVSGLVIVRDGTQGISLNQEWRATLDASIGNPVDAAGVVTDVRSFVMGMTGNWSNPKIVENDAIKMNCNLDIDRIDNTFEAIQNAAGIDMDGWAWNNVFDIDISATTNAIETLYNPNISTTARFWHNRFNIYGNAGDTNWRMCFDGTTLGDGNEWKNNIFTAENFTGVRTAILNEGNNLVNAGNIDANAYFGFTGGSDTTTDDGYGNDANKVELSSNLSLLYEPTSTDSLYRAGTTDVYLEYDINRDRRDLDFATIGPIAYALAILSTVYYGGYAIAIADGSFVTVDKVGGDTYQTLYLGSLPISVVVDGGVTKFVTISQAEAQELQENVVGGAPLLSGRIGNDWFAIERPAGTADADVEFFYKGNLLTAKRFGTKTYL